MLALAGVAGQSENAYYLYNKGKQVVPWYKPYANSSSFLTEYLKFYPSGNSGADIRTTTVHSYEGNTIMRFIVDVVINNNPDNSNNIQVTSWDGSSRVGKNTFYLNSGLYTDLILDVPISSGLQGDARIMVLAGDGNVEVHVKEVLIMTP